MTDEGRFPGGATWAGVTPEKLSQEERLRIMAGELGYCEGHRVLYKKSALPSCFIPLVFPGGLGNKCDEWKYGPKEWSPRHRNRV